VAIDLLSMDSLPGTEFILGDFTDETVLGQLLEILGSDKVDLVMSDMAPNSTGSRAVDQPRSMYLADLALDFSRQVLRQRGDFICKLFQGAGFDPFLAEVRGCFGTVKVRKPKASRPGSREVYLVARNYQLV
jgi:23S rRNA (uridine2552-2'-O)-methyltransferase